MGPLVYERIEFLKNIEFLKRILYNYCVNSLLTLCEGAFDHRIKCCLTHCALEVTKYGTGIQNYHRPRNGVQGVCRICFESGIVIYGEGVSLFIDIFSYLFNCFGTVCQVNHHKVYLVFIIVVGKLEIGHF